MIRYPILSIDMNGSLPVYLCFLGTCLSIMVFQPTDHMIESPKVQKLKKNNQFIPCNQESEEEVSLKLIF
jgi:hypothetical protein